MTARGTQPVEDPGVGGRWREIAPAPVGGASSAGQAVLRWAPALGLAFVAWLLGFHELAVVIVVVSTVVTLAAIGSDRFRRLFERLVAALTHWIGLVVSGVLQLVVFVVIFLPGFLVARVLRVDPLKIPRTGPSHGEWMAREEGRDETPTRWAFALETPTTEPSRLGRAVRLVPVAVGAVAVLVVADVGLGLRLRDRQAEATPVEAQLAIATATMPWFEDYRRELEDVAYEPEPFVLTQAVDRSGEYITIEDGLRRTYRPSGLADDAPVLALFGGSTVWGEGQRDLHTVPSELARLAEADGFALRIENHAQRGDTNFASVQRMERVVAHDDTRPDLVVLLDGPDDVAVQQQSLTGRPSHYGLEENLQHIEEDVDERTLWQRYADASLINDLVQSVKGLALARPAGAQEADPTPDEGVDASRAAIADAVVSVYERGLVLAGHISDHSSVPFRSFWLPTVDSGRSRSTYARAAAALPDEVTDLGDVVDDPDAAFLDGVHLTEAGARQVAEALYAQVRPQIEALAGAD